MASDSRELPSASLAGGISFVVLQLLPNLAAGLFSPRARVVRLVTRLDTERRAAAALARMRREHPGEAVRILGGRIVLVFGVEAIREVLDRSAEDFGSDAGAKQRGMCHFQPGAATISRDGEWRERRRFNEAVLAGPERVHPDASRFAAVVREEVAGLPAGTLEWASWEELFRRITLRIVLGDSARDDDELIGHLDAMMAEANRLVGLRESKHFDPFYERLERYLRERAPGSLAARFDDAKPDTATRAVNQVPHWLFAMKDTLAANSFRALAAIAAGAEVQRRVDGELEGADLADPRAIDGLRYLEGCLHETMRLWPTTPLLVREAIRDTTLLGAKVEEGTPVMIVNAFNHRDEESLPDGARFRPERFEGGERDYRFNHLSNGSQVCAGEHLAVFVGKAVLANVLERGEATLERPRLDLSAPLPHMLDFFDVRVRVAAPS